MAPREPTRAQLSSRLSYQQNTPAFLLKLQNRMKGITDEEEYDGEGYEEEFEYVSEGREPIPRRPRPPIPQRPTDDPGSADEEEVDENELFPDEKPQVVVLREGNILQNGKQRISEGKNLSCSDLSLFPTEKGLPPLPKPGSSVATGDLSKSKDSSKESSSSSKTANQGLSFSSSSKTAGGGNSSKRKAIGQLDELKAELNAKANTSSKDKSKVKEKIQFQELQQETEEREQNLAILWG